MKRKNRKRLTFLLSCVMIIFTTLNVSAAEETVKYEEPLTDVSMITEETMDKMGERMFPEYADKLDDDIAAKTITFDDETLSEVIYTETKDISEDEGVTYIEFASGATALMYHKSWATVSTNPFGGGTTYVKSLVVTVTGCYGSVAVSKLKYTILNSYYDFIDDQGTCMDDSGFSYAILAKKNEDANGHARAEYGGNVTDQLLGQPIGVAFEVRVGFDSASVYVNGNPI